ncbi:hypothetical protein PAPYR_9218 [Paratrimastix pyriformis]|uniref:Uncharacterized protein n=1 Tax=Paratrimastix pyriformis TaxID=342808 RepID=A0ABQ8U8T5_9EUKA|nr:hypothetical protein PAPYR_9218 [Paratrimastix pyriformis]
MEPGPTAPGPPQEHDPLQAKLECGCTMCSLCLLKHSMSCSNPQHAMSCSNPQQLPQDQNQSGEEVVYVFIDESNIRMHPQKQAENDAGMKLPPVLIRYDTMISDFILHGRKLGHVCLVADSAANVALQTHLPTFANPALASLVDLCSFDHGGVPHEIENDTGLGLKIFQRLLTPLPPGVTGVLALATGDCDFLPVVHCLQDLNLGDRWTIERYSWEHATAGELFDLPGRRFQYENDCRTLTGPPQYRPNCFYPSLAECEKCHLPSTLAQLGCHRICYQCLVDASMQCPLCCSPARPFSKEHFLVLADESNFWLSARSRAKDLNLRLSLPGMAQFVLDDPRVGPSDLERITERHVFHSHDPCLAYSEFVRSIPGDWVQHPFGRKLPDDKGKASEKQVSNSVVRAICERLALPLPPGVGGVIVLFAGKGAYAPLLRDFIEQQQKLHRFPNWRIVVVGILGAVSPLLTGPAGARMGVSRHSITEVALSENVRILRLNFKTPFPHNPEPSDLFYLSSRVHVPPGTIRAVEDLISHPNPNDARLASLRGILVDCFGASQPDVGRVIETARSALGTPVTCYLPRLSLVREGAKTVVRVAQNKLLFLAHPEIPIFSLTLQCSGGFPRDNELSGALCLEICLKHTSGPPIRYPQTDNAQGPDLFSTRNPSGSAHCSVTGLGQHRQQEFILRSRWVVSGLKNGAFTFFSEVKDLTYQRNQEDADQAFLYFETQKAKDDARALLAKRQLSFKELPYLLGRGTVLWDLIPSSTPARIQSLFGTESPWVGCIREWPSLRKKQEEFGRLLEDAFHPPQDQDQNSSYRRPPQVCHCPNSAAPSATIPCVTLPIVQMPPKRQSAQENNSGSLPEAQQVQASPPPAPKSPAPPPAAKSAPPPPPAPVKPTTTAKPAAPKSPAPPPAAKSAPPPQPAPAKPSQQPSQQQPSHRRHPLQPSQHRRPNQHQPSQQQSSQQQPSHRRHPSQVSTAAPTSTNNSQASSQASSSQVTGATPAKSAPPQPAKRR